jgi:hypothetical protein
LQAKRVLFARIHDFVLSRRRLLIMLRSYTLPRRLIVEARDLDTDARTRQELDVDAPTDEAGQRAQLVSVVARLHPEARMRSFGNGAASFLDSSHLVVAHYAEAREPRPALSVPDASTDVQQPLFVG